MTAKQGHRYRHEDDEVLALESGDDLVRVALINHMEPYPLGAARYVAAADLVPMPMRYFHGATPI